MVEGPAPRFLWGRVPDAVRDAHWGRNGIALRIASYLSDDEPPAELVTSVRAVVGHGGGLLCWRIRMGNTSSLEAGSRMEKAICRRWPGRLRRSVV